MDSITMSKSTRSNLESIIAPISIQHAWPAWMAAGTIIGLLRAGATLDSRTPIKNAENTGAATADQEKRPIAAPPPAASKPKITRAAGGASAGVLGLSIDIVVQRVRCPRKILPHPPVVGL